MPQTNTRDNTGDEKPQHHIMCHLRSNRHLKCDEMRNDDQKIWLLQLLQNKVALLLKQQPKLSYFLKRKGHTFHHLEIRRCLLATSGPTRQTNYIHAHSQRLPVAGTPENSLSSGFSSGKTKQFKSLANVSMVKHNYLRQGEHEMY